MNDSCSLQRRLELRESAAWTANALDLVTCSRLEICVSLFEHERAEGLRPEKWPREVWTQFDKYLAEWIGRNGDRAIRAVTYAVPICDGRQCCVMILHHAPAKR